MEETTDKQVPKQLKPYLFKKGQSGNPNGRPKGKTLKEFAREYLESLPDDEKVEYLQSLSTELIWQMAEGKPKQDTDITTNGESIQQVLVQFIDGKTNETIKNNPNSN